jgi:hypothetical protein
LIKVGIATAVSLLAAIGLAVIAGFRMTDFFGTVTRRDSFLCTGST